jgi:hypothetical protein
MSAFISSNSKKAFISSTSTDLGKYREAAYEVCNRLSIVPIGMEQFESMGVGATEGSKSRLNEADVYVGIVANRYGYIEDGYDKSVTELEFDHAGERGLDRLCFVAEEGAELPKYPEDQVKLAAFKGRIGKLIRNTFGTPWEFRYKLYDSVLKWLFREQGTGPLARHIFEPLFVRYARFGGRADVLDQVKTFIDSPKAGYLVITGPAGYGKTALAVKLVELNRDITAYHFFTDLYGSESGSEFLSEQFFLKNVVEQIRLWNFFPYDTWEAPTTLSGWVAAYQQLITTPLREKHILLIDGLDEVKAWSLRPYLTAELPNNLKIIVTLRDLGQAWVNEYGFPKTQTQHVPLVGLTRADVRDVLRLAGPVAAAVSGDGALLDKLVKVTSPAGTVAGADPLYVRLLADDLEERRITAADIDKQAPSLEENLKRWWKETQKRAKKDPAAFDLLTTLAASLGPIQREDLINLHPSLKPSLASDPFETALGSMRGTVAGTDETGYSFAHPRYRDYLRHYDEVKAFETTLLAYCKDWRARKGLYALTYAVQHMAMAGEYDDLFATVLDESFHAAQREAFRSVRPTLNDCARAIEIACDKDRFLDTLQCVTTYRRLARSEGLARAAFKDIAEGRFDAAGRKAAEGELGVKTSSSWVLVLRCYLVWAAAQAGDRKAAAALVEEFGRQFGLRYHGAASYASDLCDALIASAIDIVPALAPQIGVDAEWASAVLGRIRPPVPTPEVVAERLRDVESRAQLLETVFGENPSLVDFIEEERAGQYVASLKDTLIALAPDPAAKGMIDRLLAMVEANPYPRYRDNALVALGVATLAVPDRAWCDARMQSIVETGLDKEGVTFTFDLPAQLVAEADRRGLTSGGLGGYLAQAAGSFDRWGTRLRSTSAQAAADFVQGRNPDAFTKLESAGTFDQGFAGYMSAHLLAIASRWWELGGPKRIGQLGLVEKSRSHAARVRDPRFAKERGELVDRFEQWLAAPVPEWDDVSALLRATPEPDNRRAYKDLASARWSAERKWGNWGQLLVAALADATALDFVLGRLAARAIRRHCEGVHEFPDAALAEAITLCSKNLATSRPWELGTPAYA